MSLRVIHNAVVGQSSAIACELWPCFFLVLEKRDLNSRTVRKIAASAHVLIASRELAKETPYKSQ